MVYAADAVLSDASYAICKLARKQLLLMNDVLSMHWKNATHSADA